MQIKGKYTTATIHTENIEDAAVQQIQEITDSPAFENQSVHYMPDVHAGSNCTVGFTATLGDYINPSHIGGDIGCAVSHVRLANKIPTDKYAEFNHRVRNVIPYDIQERPVINEKDFFRFLTKRFNAMRQQWSEHLSNLPDTVTETWVDEQLKRVNMDKSVFYKQLGTFGSGNHFIEYGECGETSFIELPWWNQRQKPVVAGICTDDEFVGTDPEQYRMTFPFVAGITVHCGSRNFGQKVCRYWQAVAERGISKEDTKALKKQFKEDWKKTHWKDKTGYDEALAEYLKSAESNNLPGYLTGDELNGYLCDMCFAQVYAQYNHYTIHRLIKEILEKYSVRALSEVVYCPHNYIDMRDHIIRKGSISAYDTEKVIIPFNMRDGIAVCVGKSNPDWNFSGPHGAGRSMSRAQARKNIAIEDYAASMQDVYSTSVCRETIDESPQAYKPAEEIRKLIEPTVEVLYLLPARINIKSTKSE